VPCGHRAKASALGLNPVAFDPYIPPGSPAAQGVHMVSLDELLEEHDPRRLAIASGVEVGHCTVSALRERAGNIGETASDEEVQALVTAVKERAYEKRGLLDEGDFRQLVE